MEKQLNYVIVTAPNLWRDFLRVNITEKDRPNLADELMKELGVCMVDFLNPKEWKDESVCNQYAISQYGLSLEELDKYSIEYEPEYGYVIPMF